MNRWAVTAWTVGSLLALLAGIGWYAVSPTLMFYPMLGLLLVGAVPAIMDVRRHVVLLFYLLAFFTFIFGRMVVVEVFGYRAEEEYLLGTQATDEGVLVTTFGVYLLFLTALLVAYWAPRTLRPGLGRGGSQQPDPWRTDALRRGALVAFYALLLPYLIYLALVGQFVATESYYVYQQDRSAAAPGFLRFFDDAMVLAFISYLATRPRLRDLRVHGVVFVVARLGALVTMERNAAVIPILVLAAYTLAHLPRSWTARWASRRMAAVAAGAGVAAVASLWLFARMNASRGTGGQTVGVWHAPLEFLFGQGTTINVGVLTNSLGEAVPRDRFYSFGPIIEFVQLRLIHPFTGDYGYLTSHNAARAEQGHQLAHTFSYEWMGQSYLDGASYGSSAPVELWLDFGFVGVIAGGALTGALLSVLSAWITGRFWQVLLTLVLVQGLWFSPRASFSEVLVTISVRTMAAAVLLSVFLYVYTRCVERSDRRPAAVDAP